MTSRRTIAALLALALTGCTGDQQDGPTVDLSRVEEARKGAGNGGGATMSAISPPVEVADGVATLTPANTAITFVGSKPNGDSHDGGFNEFSGELTVDPETDDITALTMEIDLESIWTDAEKLTNHLKNPDFFDVRTYPAATFASTSVEKGEGYDYTVKGDLTMHGETNAIDIPVTTSVSDDGISLTAEFAIDRMAFGVDYQPDGIDAEVPVTVKAGSAKGSATDSAGGGRRGGGGRGGFDPAAMFDRRDEDGDGKLSGDEIPERMRERLDSIDADGDGAVTLEEMRAGMTRRGGDDGQDNGGEEGSGEAGEPEGAAEAGDGDGSEG